MEENKTWDIVVPSDNAEVIDSKRVIREKEDNDIVKKKARLDGFKQYSLTENVARIATIKVLLCQ